MSAVAVALSSDVSARLAALIETTVRPHAAAVDADCTFPTHTIDALREAGLLGLVTPTRFGGLGGGVVDAARVVEAIAQACGTSAMVVCMHYAGATVLAAHGSEAVNREVAAGRHLSTLAFSEAGSRSHFWAPLSTARTDGEAVVLDADKSWITSATHADAFVWSSRPVSATGASTIWLVPAKAAGLTVPAPFRGLGLRGNDSSPVKATGVRIAADARLGPDGGGFDVMMGTVLPVFNVMNAACSVGLMEAALTGAANHVKGTSLVHLESALAQLPTVRATLAKARVQADAARMLWEDALSALADGRPDAMLRVLEVKAAANDAALEVSQACMRVCGGAAFRKEVGVERVFRDAQAGAVMAPTADVLYDFVGKAITGLPLF